MRSRALCVLESPRSIVPSRILTAEVPPTYKSPVAIELAQTLHALAALACARVFGASEAGSRSCAVLEQTPATNYQWAAGTFHETDLKSKTALKFVGLNESKTTPRTHILSCDQLATVTGSGEFSASQSHKPKWFCASRGRYLRPQS